MGKSILLVRGRLGVNKNVAKLIVMPVLMCLRESKLSMRSQTREWLLQLITVFPYMSLWFPLCPLSLCNRYDANLAVNAHICLKAPFVLACLGRLRGPLVIGILVGRLHDII